MFMQAKQAARKNKKKKKATEPHHITRAVTHIRRPRPRVGRSRQRPAKIVQANKYTRPI
jgi:hypothetical protein